jgi:hypothetical protein
MTSLPHAQKQASSPKASMCLDSDLRLLSEQFKYCLRHHGPRARCSGALSRGRAFATAHIMSLTCTVAAAASLLLMAH